MYSYGAPTIFYQNPPNSYDLNVLDYHTWNHMDQMVQENKPKNTQEMKRLVVNAWKKINLAELQKAVLSWEKRMKLCVSEKGDRFGHKL